MIDIFITTFISITFGYIWGWHSHKHELERMNIRREDNI